MIVDIATSYLDTCKHYVTMQVCLSSLRRNSAPDEHSNNRKVIPPAVGEQGIYDDIQVPNQQRRSSGQAGENVGTNAQQGDYIELHARQGDSECGHYTGLAA